MNKYLEPWAIYTCNDPDCEIATDFGEHEDVFSDPDGEGFGGAIFQAIMGSKKHVQRAVDCVNALTGIGNPEVVRKIVNLAEDILNLDGQYHPVKIRFKGDKKLVKEYQDSRNKIINDLDEALYELDYDYE